MNQINSATEKKSRYLIKSVIKAFQILETMSRYNDEIRIKDLTKIMNMEQSTVHRFLLTLEHLGYANRKNGGLKLRVGTT